MSRISRLFLALPFALLGVVSCTSDEPFIPVVAESNYATSLGVDLANSTRTSTGLYYRDIVVGGGTLMPTDTAKEVTIAYVVSLRNGKEVDQGTITFTTGTGGVILGVDEGVKGMAIGGERQLIVSPLLGYGDRPQAGIPAYSILVFTVNLLNVQAP